MESDIYNMPLSICFFDLSEYVYYPADVYHFVYQVLQTTRLLTITTLFYGAPGVNRTPGQWFRKPLLYPLSYGGNRQVKFRKVATTETADHVTTSSIRHHETNPVAEISESGARFKRE